MKDTEYPDEFQPEIRIPLLLFRFRWGILRVAFPKDKAKRKIYRKDVRHTVWENRIGPVRPAEVAPPERACDMDTLGKLGRCMAAIVTAVAAVLSIYAGCLLIREKIVADFHYRKAGHKRGYFRTMEFGWHLRRGETAPIRVHTREP